MWMQVFDLDETKGKVYEGLVILLDDIISRRCQTLISTSASEAWKCVPEKHRFDILAMTVLDVMAQFTI